MIKNYLLMAVGLFVFIIVGPVLIGYNYVVFFLGLLVGIIGVLIFMKGLLNELNKEDEIID